MSKRAEDKANEYVFNLGSPFPNTERCAFSAGYRQAQKDTMKWVQHYILTHDTIDIFEMEDEFNKENEQ